LGRDPAYGGQGANSQQGSGDMQTRIKSPEIAQAKIIRALEALPDYSPRNFTPFEVEAIRKYVPTKGIKAVARLLGRSVRQVMNKHYKLREAESWKA
jgi:hypothetical protein